jgi:hypothetical protein
MNTATRFQMPSATDDSGFERIGSQEPIVEHQTIPFFVNSIDRNWNIEEVKRYGKQVGATAEALQLAFVTVNDRSLGYLRVFPVPLLRRVYELMAPQFDWPALPSSLEGQRPKLNEKLAAHLRALYEVAPDVAVKQSIATVLTFMDREGDRHPGA